MKKVLILGPFGNNGGRDYEAQLIAASLESMYKVQILSTGEIQPDYKPLEVLKNTKIQSLNRLLFQNYFFLRILAYLGYVKNRFKKRLETYVNSKISKKFLHFESKKRILLEKEIIKSDLVLMVVQLSSKFVSETIDLCEKNKIPCLLRTTGTIKRMPESLKPFLEKVSCFIHHSKQNAANLSEYIKQKYVIIDQCAIGEEQLLKIPIQFKKPLRFGFLGRLSPEKQIEELLEYFISTNKKLIIAGDGPLKEKVQNLADTKPTIKYLGFINNNNLDLFFKEIDILIISSIEETGPLVGLEAMAAGKIVITTNVGAMKERLEGYRLPFLEKDLSNLNFLIELVEKKEIEDLYQMASFLRTKYLDLYTLESIKKLYFNLVKDTLIKNAHR